MFRFRFNFRLAEYYAYVALHQMLFISPFHGFRIGVNQDFTISRIRNIEFELLQAYCLYAKWVLVTLLRLYATKLLINVRNITHWKSNTYFSTSASTVRLQIWFWSHSFCWRRIRKVSTQYYSYALCCFGFKYNFGHT